MDRGITGEAVNGRRMQRLVLLDGVDLGEERPHAGHGVSTSRARLDEDVEVKGLLK